MKVALLLTLPFLLFAFFTNLSLASSNFAEQVRDLSGRPIFPGGRFFVLSIAPGGGLKLAQTENSTCPVTILQDSSRAIKGLIVKFSIPGYSTGIIFTGTPLEIEFTTEKPKCASSSKWTVFEDKKFQKACLGIGGAQDHPGQTMRNGTFNIQRHKVGYKFAFYVNGSSTCLDVAKFNANNGENGDRLYLTDHDEPFEIGFLNAIPPPPPDADIKKVA